MACRCCQTGSHVPYIRSSVQRGTVSVRHGGSVSSVRLAALNVRRESGRRLVALADVWWAASFPLDPARLRVDLVGDDGFDTALKRGEPLTGDALIHGFVDVDTRDVSWTTDVPCFYRVKGMVTLSARLHLRAMVSAP